MLDLAVWLGMTLTVITLIRAIMRQPQSPSLMDRVYQQGFQAALCEQPCLNHPYQGVLADLWADGYVAGRACLTQPGEALCN